MFIFYGYLFAWHNRETSVKMIVSVEPRIFNTP